MLNLKTAAAAGGIATLVAGLKNFAEQGNELVGFSHKARLSVETIRGFDGIAEKFHVDPAELRQTEMTLVDSMYRIRKHRGEFYAYLKAQRPADAAALAATPETEAGNEKALRLTLQMLDKIKKERDETTARIFAKENFGSDALVDLIRDGLPALDEAVARYRALSGAMDPSKGEAFAKAFSDFKASLQGLENQAGADFLPKITEGVRELDRICQWPQAGDRGRPRHGCPRCRRGGERGVARHQGNRRCGQFRSDGHGWLGTRS